MFSLSILADCIHNSMKLFVDSILWFEITWSSAGFSALCIRIILATFYCAKTAPRSSTTSQPGNDLECQFLEGAKSVLVPEILKTLVLLSDKFSTTNTIIWMNYRKYLFLILSVKNYRRCHLKLHLAQSSWNTRVRQKYL